MMIVGSVSAEPECVHYLSIVGLLPHDPRIIAQKFGSEVCAAKSSDCLNPYFVHNIYIAVT